MLNNVIQISNAPGWIHTHDMVLGSQYGSTGHIV